MPPKCSGRCLEWLRAPITIRLASAFARQPAHRCGAIRSAACGCRANIADYLGLTIETVSRLKVEGVIRLAAGNEVRLNIEKLAEIAEGWGD